MRIAIVDGYATTRFLVTELAQRGTECIHVQSGPHPPHAYQRVFDPSIYLGDLGFRQDVGDTTARLRDFDVHQVVAGAESGVELADRLNHELGTPGNDITKAQARRDKFAMIEAARESGLVVPASAIVTSPSDAVEWFAASDARAAVVKPVASAGTDGVSVCRDAEQIADRVAEVLGTNDFFGALIDRVVVQEFLDGTEFMVNTVSVGGDHKVVDVWRSVRTHGPKGAPICDFQEPLPLCDPDVQQVAEYALAVITALGITDGAGHTEVMLTQDGPRLIESAARLMGGFLPWISAKYSGTSQIHLLATALTDPQEFHAFTASDATFSRHVRNVWLINPEAGVGRDDGWQQRVESLPTFVALNTKVRPGQVVPMTVDLPSAPGFVSLASDRLADIERDQRAIRRMEEQRLYVA